MARQDDADDVTGVVADGGCAVAADPATAGVLSTYSNLHTGACFPSQCPRHRPFFPGQQAAAGIGHFIEIYNVRAAAREPLEFLVARIPAQLDRRLICSEHPARPVED